MRDWIRKRREQLLAYCASGLTTDEYWMVVGKLRFLAELEKFIIDQERAIHLEDK